MSKGIVKSESNLNLPALSSLDAHIPAAVLELLSKQNAQLAQMQNKLVAIERKRKSLEAKLEKLAGYAELKAEIKDLNAKERVLKEAIGKKGYAINDTMMSSLDHLPGETLLDKIQNAERSK